MDVDVASTAEVDRIFVKRIGSRLDTASEERGLTANARGRKSGTSSSLQQSCNGRRPHGSTVSNAVFCVVLSSMIHG